MAQRDAMFEPDKVRIGKQIVLPITKAIEISLKSLRIRFWRSMITISGIILAIAFLTFVWTSNEIQHRIQGLPETVKDYVELEEIMAKKGLELGATTEGLEPKYVDGVSLTLQMSYHLAVIEIAPRFLIQRSVDNKENAHEIDPSFSTMPIVVPLICSPSYRPFSLRSRPRCRTKKEP